jgi:hypothetical protein
MKKITCIIVLLAFILACNKNKDTATKSNESLWAENVVTILPFETDTVWDKSDLTNASNKFDREKIISSIRNAVLSGKLKAYSNYPNEELTVKQVQNIFVKWDSTVTAEDPNNPGSFIPAPVKMEITADEIPYIEFNEKIQLDTITYSISKKVSYITLYSYKFTESGYVIGVRKLFDVKLND